MQQVDTVWAAENAANQVASDQGQLGGACDFAYIVPSRGDHKQGTPIKQPASKCSGHSVLRLGDMGWVGIHVVATKRLIVCQCVVVGRLYKCHRLAGVWFWLCCKYTKRGVSKQADR